MTWRVSVELIDQVVLSGLAKADPSVSTAVNFEVYRVLKEKPG